MPHYLLVRDAREILITSNNSGPDLYVTGDLIDQISTAVTTTPVTGNEVPAGTPVVFCREANADVLGLPVTGYRYGWDVVDSDNDDAWPMPFTPFGQKTECSGEQTFHFGTHLFSVEAILYDGFKARVSVLITMTDPTPTESTTWGRIEALCR